MASATFKTAKKLKLGAVLGVDILPVAHRPSTSVVLSKVIALDINDSESEE